ncbi:MAG: GrpB family protein, partial [Gaiellaceae bacterium]
MADLVRIVPYDPAWPDEFEAERALLEPVLAPWLGGAIHHVGSTSVPGLGAKPVIDILAEVRSLEESRAAIEPLQALSYWWAPYKEEHMNWFCKPSPERRTHHLHMIVPGSQRWREELTFRDALRAEPETARAYEDLKRRLAGELAKDREVQKREITIEDLLTMRSGLESTSGRGYGAWVQSPNWVRSALAKPMVAERGADMEYSTGTSHVLSA